MKQWKVVYQPVPYTYTAPGALLVEADSPAEAWAVAYDELTRRGMDVFVPFAGPGSTVCSGTIQFSEVQQFGVPACPPNANRMGNVHIRSCEEHKVTVKGRVIG